MTNVVICTNKHGSHIQDIGITTLNVARIITKFNYQRKDNNKLKKKRD